MSAQPKAGIDVDACLAWAEQQPGRYELVDGEIFALSPQRVRHAETKFSVQFALRGGLRAAGLACHMLPDGITVRVDAATCFEPDALVYCGERLGPDVTQAPAPSSWSRFCPRAPARSTPHRSASAISVWRA